MLQLLREALVTASTLTDPMRGDFGDRDWQDLCMVVQMEQGDDDARRNLARLKM
jgi:hypothetical protein